MKYKILIFDLDDTLIDDKQNARYAFEKILENQKEQYSEDKFERWYEIDKKFWLDWQNGKIKLPEKLQEETGKKSEGFLNWLRAQRILRYFENNISLERAIELNNIFMESLTEVVIPIEGAYDTLKHLSQKYYIIIATNGPNIATKAKLAKINCLEFVNLVLSADIFGYMKPKVDFFKAIQNLTKNYSNNDYLIIGNSLKSDVGFGMASGIDSCWFDRDEENIMEEYRPTMVIKSLDMLKNKL